MPPLAEPRTIDLRTRWTTSLTIAVAAAGTLAALRGLPFIVWPHSAFDSDQAIVGLMAKHLSEGRALPLFFYGQPYMLAVQAWITAPLFVIGGASIALLKLPLLIVNALVAALLVRTLIRDADLPPASAFFASVFFALCPVIPGAQLVAAMGGSVEPFLYVLLIWMLRERPILCGLIAGIGFLHREFTAYGLGALLITVTAYRPRDWRQWAPRWLAIAAVFLAVIEGGRVVRPFGDMFGPDMPKLRGVSAVSNVEAIAVRVECTNGLEIGENVRWLARQNLPTLAGTSGMATNLFFAGPAISPSPIVWVVLVTVLVLSAVRAAGLAWFSRTPIPAILVFLLLVGVQAMVVYVSRCGVRDPTLIRYTLFTLLIPVAVFAAYLRLEPVRALRWSMIGLLALWLVWSAGSYVSLVIHYVSHPPISRHAIMAAELERRNIRYGYAGYWDAHHINFLTNERVILAPVPPSRIYSYDAMVWHAPEKFFVQPTPCPGELIGSLWLCPASSPPATAARKTSSEITFPSRSDAVQFRQALETKYRVGLRREPTFSSAVDREGLVQWTQEYVRYRLTGCRHTAAQLRVFMQIDGFGVQAPCETEDTLFPPRDELVAFRQDLERKYRDGLRRGQTASAVDAVGDIIWTAEYIQFRINGCAHDQAVPRVMTLIDGKPAPGC